MSVTRNWVLMVRGLRSTKGLRSRNENQEDAVNLDFTLDLSSLMQEILSNICKKDGISNLKKLNYLNALVHLLNKNSDWKSVDMFGYSTEEILSCLRVAFLHDSVQIRAVGLRALRYIVRTEENVLTMNKLHFPYLIARSLDLLLKSDNERVLMSERIQSLKMMRHILSIAPQYFSSVLVRPLVSVVMRPVEETDRLLKACTAVLCELCLLNNAIFIECDGVRALLRNATLIPSSHIVEAICGSLLFLLNKPQIRDVAKVDLRYLISGYTNSVVTDKNSFREEERRLAWTNFALLTLLKSSSGIFELCDAKHNGLQSIIQTLYLNKTSIRKSILELLYELINIGQPEWTDDEAEALEFIDSSQYSESYKLSEGFLVAEGNHFLPSLIRNRVNLIETHTSLLLVCLLETGLPDALVEVIVSSDAAVSLSAAILLGEILNLVRKLLPQECYDIPPALPNLVSYAVRGSPMQLPSFSPTNSKDWTSRSNSDEQYSNLSQCSKDVHKINNDLAESRNSVDVVVKTLDLRISYPNLNVPVNCTTKSSLDKTVVTKDATTSLTDVTSADALGSVSAQNVTHNINVALDNASDIHSVPTLSEEDSILNLNRIDLPPCKQKQRMALSAISILSSLQKKFEKPRQPVSLLLSHVAQYGEGAPTSFATTTNEGSEDKDAKTKLNKIPTKELEDIMKETAVLIVPDANRWKWDSIRILLRLGVNNNKILNDANFKMILKKLIHFYKPSSKKYSHIPLKYETARLNIYTLVACDLFDILLDARTSDGLKLMREILDDLSSQLAHVMDAKSLHDCFLSPLRLSNSLSQDYFLLVGRLSNSDVGLLVLQETSILSKLQYIATHIILDCYVKLIISSLSYISSDETRKLYSSVLSCDFASSRLYATKYLSVLLRMNVCSKRENFRNWLIEMMVNQLYDDNQTIAQVALNALNEAADDKNCLDVLISMRPSLLHLGDAGLLLLIRFLSTEKGFQYLQTANFVNPQLQRWASSFNIKYVQIVEGDLHDALTQYQRGEDGRFRKRVTGHKAKLKDVIVPPHLYGQLVQHQAGFELLIKQDDVHKLIRTILLGEYSNDKTIMHLKMAMWAMGHICTSSVGTKYLRGHGVIKAICRLAENASAYSVKMTAIYVLAMVATTKEGVSALTQTNWRCLKHSRHENYVRGEGAFFVRPVFKPFESDDSCETVLSPTNCEYSRISIKSGKEVEDKGMVVKLLSKFSLDKKSSTLPQRNVSTSQIQHNRSFSESKADCSGEWLSPDSPSSDTQTFTPKTKSTSEVAKMDTCGTDCSTSGISSCDSARGHPLNYGERGPFKLSPSPSISSLSTIMPLNNTKEYHKSLLSKRHSSISFGYRLNGQNTLGYKTLRAFQNRHLFSSSPAFSASATMEYLSAPERRQMSPLVRPKFPRYHQKPPICDFEVRNIPFQVDENDECLNISAIESSQFSHSTEIDDSRVEFEGPCYRGICLPVRSSYLFSSTSKDPSSSSTNKQSQIQKCKYDLEVSEDSDSEQHKCCEDSIETFRHLYKRKRHDKMACLLCSMKPNFLSDRNAIRSRRTSSSSVHRIRTETESSYGGGIAAADTESPILLTWQQKPVGLADNTPGGASCSTLENSDSHSISAGPTNDTALRSRSILRREILKIVEQLGNPVLYRTCKQGLLHLKQVCGELFQDICLFSDVCVMLGSINYKIQARQLIQDLFLDAPFSELFEEANAVLNRGTDVENHDDFRSNKHNVAELPVLQSETKMSLPLNSFTVVSKDASTNQTNQDSKSDERKNNNLNGGLQIIIESNTPYSGVARSEENTLHTIEKMTGPEEGNSLLIHDITSNFCTEKSIKNGRFKNVYDCRRAYSYPARNCIIAGYGIPNENSVPHHNTMKIATTRSRSVSATCSYISEITMSRPFINCQDDLTPFNSILLDTSNLTLSEHSVISFGDRSSPILLTFDNPYNCLDFKSSVLINDVANTYAFDKSSKGECQSSQDENESII